MKTILFIVFLFVSGNAVAQVVTDSVARKHKISKVIYTFNLNIYFIEHHDTSGRRTMFESIDSGLSERTTTVYRYRDGLLIAEEFAGYYKDTLMYVQFNNYLYDSAKRVVSIISDFDGTQSLKDSFRYTSASVDTMLTYSGGEKPETFQLHKVSIRYYDQQGKMQKQIARMVGVNKCRADSAQYIVTDFYSRGDTSIEKETMWNCNSGKRTAFKKTAKISATRMYKEEGGNKSWIVDTFKSGLLTTKKITTVGSYGKSEMVMHFRYEHYK